MTKPISPMAVGGFVLGGLVLMIGGILWFGGKNYFQPKVNFVVYFDSSLNGLMIGAPVSVQGVQVGSVKKIDIMLDRETLVVLKPVVLEVDQATLRDLQAEKISMGFGRERQVQTLKKLIDAGLRARLELQSLLTGRLYVELSFYPGEPAHLVGKDYEGYLEIPSMPTRTDELRNTLEDLVRQYRKIPIDKIVQDFTATMSNVRDLTSSDELKAARRELALALGNARELLDKLNRKVDPLAATFQLTAHEIKGLVKDFRAEAKPLAKTAESALAAAQRALMTADGAMRKLEGALESAESFTAPDSGLDQAIVELRATSRAVRDLAEALERNPNSLLFGKP